MGAGAGAHRRLACAGPAVGFTNGCFDLIHPGHVRLLAQARAACDRLVVGLNSDASVRRLKGPTRPVQNEAARATVMASIASADLVMLFEEDTPERLIAAIRPDLLFKGADYRPDQVVGGDFVRGLWRAGGADRPGTGLQHQRDDPPHRHRRPGDRLTPVRPAASRPSRWRRAVSIASANTSCPMASECFSATSACPAADRRCHRASSR